MDLRAARIGLALVAAALCASCARDGELAGAWRSKVQFADGAFASIKDLEFMYAFNAGGTMTESSNYDAAPPVPPAYGIWRVTGPNRFEARYEFYASRPPAGRGVFVETITLSDDGRSFTSTIRYEAYDAAGQPIEGGGSATGQGERLTF
ncbi:MAG TPA: hypothetical protein VFB67_06805 [Candidatus Polarisedimenticolaceae bacterium]|nr:hypothetical protein [Candidatus Polarisedimenticolaceae bacterium]